MRAAISRSWVITAMVVPVACSSFNRSSTARPFVVSSAPVGSSASTSAGRFTNVLPVQFHGSGGG
ncbi:hypothetical protein H4W33_010977 [Kibdelosporangium phytohabitans]|uniref:Uncharacterized protein n=1 Tax=Kibdelosporangium phytohabitans TaxID=860235 RepID=A0A0N9HUU3_9PSEU|nr:hypothetical protein AOZ06_10190 [Kibdelosporangium phytohabitans]MBE1471903.1 hypothetical protein [Kibdelosporangium phytohabitans]